MGVPGESFELEVAEETRKMVMTRKREKERVCLDFAIKERFEVFLYHHLVLGQLWLAYYIGKLLLFRDER